LRLATARPSPEETILLLAVGFRRVFLITLEALQLLEQPVHLVLKITQPTFDSGVLHWGAAAGRSTAT
jgi:hypothetical protein